ncbi:ABC transporter permease [bacterium AH-315-I18]|nr:ABC transporter permease [Phycisphaeraceae bacterium]MBN4061028.1 ABC transporter permease [bacterium AH-315-I18]
MQNTDSNVTPFYLKPLAMLGRLGFSAVKIATDFLDYMGGVWVLVISALRWIWRSITLPKIRFGRPAFYVQLVRLGAQSVGVILLVSFCIGLILALQMAPPLEEFGQVETVANIIAVAIVRELGPLISAIVLTGFAGASIAAEIGTMAVNEEIEALEAHALNPIRFLVVPRLIATVVALLVLAIMADLIGLFAGYLIGITKLQIPSAIYINNTINQLDIADFGTGLFKACVFGILIGSISCYNGLRVSGGAAGVGKATTNTVVHSIVAIIFCDLIFTAIFFAIGWT